MAHTTSFSSNNIVIIVAVIAIITASTIGWYTAIAIKNNHANFSIAYDDSPYENYKDEWTAK